MVWEPNSDRVQGWRSHSRDTFEHWATILISMCFAGEDVVLFLIGEDTGR